MESHDQAAKSKYKLRLYITGLTPRSIEALENIKRILETHLKGRYELEVRDIRKHPERAAEAQLVAAPTMVKELPEPLRKFVGDMSDEERILLGLDLAPTQPEGDHDT